MKSLIFVGFLLVMAEAWRFPSYTGEWFPNLLHNSFPYFDNFYHTQLRQEEIRMKTIWWVIRAFVEGINGDQAKGLNLYTCLLKTVLNYTRFESRLAELGRPVQFRLGGQNCTAFLTAIGQVPLQFNCVYGINPSCSSGRTNGSIGLNISCKVGYDIHTWILIIIFSSYRQVAAGLNTQR